jgi:AI-2 transport protein TqsA
MYHFLKDCIMINARILNFTLALVALWLTVSILVVGKSMLIPLVTAVVIWYLLVRLMGAFSQLPFTQIVLPKSLALLLALIATANILYLFIDLVSSSVNGIASETPLYQEKIQNLASWISQVSDGKVDVQQVIHSINMTQIFSALVVTLTSIAGNMGLTIVYVIFLMLEYETFDVKLKAIANNKSKLKTSSEIIDKIITDINAYMKIKTLMSLATAVLVYIILYAFGVPYSQFWALLAFILNFIPTIGSAIAIGVTLLAVSIHFTELTPFLAMTGMMLSTHFLIGDIIEPRLMGRNLNLSPLVILLSLAFWGGIWGVIGMFLCVPLMTMINIVLSKFEQTRYLAILFAADPETITAEKLS